MPKGKALKKQYLFAEDIWQYLYNLKNLNIFHVILFVPYDLMRFLG